MLDKLEEIFINLKERLTSPLISSFIISWIVINWNIILQLFWFNAKPLDGDGFDKYIISIDNIINIKYGLLYPLLIALGYTFVYPLFRILIEAFLSLTNRWGNQWNIKIQKSGSIPVMRYLEIKENYESAIIKLQETISAESKTVTELSNLENELTNLRTELNEKEKIILEYSKRENISIINGRWKNKFVSKKYPQLKGEEICFIEHGKYYRLNEKNEPTLIARITNFQFFSSSNELFFIKELEEKYSSTRPDGDKLLINRLIFSPDRNIMQGSENEEIQIRYTKIEM